MSPRFPRHVISTALYKREKKSRAHVRQGGSIAWREIIAWFSPAVLVCAFFAQPLLGQVSASISGNLADPSGAALSGAAVTVTNLETGLRRRMVTDNTGDYAAPALPVGLYDVQAEAPGFESQTETGVDLEVSQQLTLNFILAVASQPEHVTVSARPGPLNVGTQQGSGLVDEKQVKNLPLNGRSYDLLLTLNPGIVNYTGEKTGGPGISNSALANMFAVSGRRPQENLFLLNGVEYTSVSEVDTQPGGPSGQLLGVDAVREFNVATDTYGAEYGKRPGAQVSIVTSGGSNTFHGSAFEFLRNSALDARNFFDHRSIPRFKRNQFGGLLGGPLERDKTFFFVNYEGFRQRLGLTDVTMVPDANARLGYLPDSTGQLANVGVNPSIEPLLSLWPAPNGPDLGQGVAEAFSNPPQSIREDFGTVRLDHIASGHDTVSAAYTLDDGHDVTPNADPISVALLRLREQVLSAEETHAFSPAVLNTARLGFSRAGFSYTGTTTENFPSFITGRPIGVVIIGGGAASNSPSQVTAAGGNIGSNLRAVRNLFTVEDNVAVTHGRHSILAGAWFERIQANDGLTLAQYGQAIFPNLTSFLEGVTGTFTAAPNPTALGWRSLEGAFFAQDSMRLKPTLTLILGLRDEFTNGWNEAYGRAANLAYGPNGALETNAQVGNSIFTVNRAKFLPQPRVALAWQPAARTVIRAGAGLYADLQDNLSFRLDADAPFNTTLVWAKLPVSALPINSLGPAGSLPSGSAIAYGGIQPDLHTPIVEAYTFEVQRELPTGTVVSVGYTGSHGYHEIVALDANQAIPVICPAVACPAGLAAGTPYYPAGVPRANPNLANTWSWFSPGSSSYNALVIDAEHRSQRGLNLRANYTYGKSLDNGSSLNQSAAFNAPGTASYPADLPLDWGPSPFDVRQRFSANASYALPFGAGKAWLAGSTGWRSVVLSGWTTEGIASVQSGFPFTPQLGFNPSRNGDTRNPVRPSWNPGFSGPVILGAPQQYFNPNAFELPVAGTYGNVARDPLAGPGLAQMDFAARKDTALTERVKLQFRAEFFNLFNRANFNTPNPVVFASAGAPPSASAGVITNTATTSRQIQFGLKVIW